MAPSNGRIASIDILRGIAITGMILCANIGFQSDLPTWMFHAQTPPPTYAFAPDVAGITWVDLVFPFFLFSMGAAFPFAMKKRLENGQSKWSVAGSLVKRWLILTIFALVIGNTDTIFASSRPAWQINMYIIGVWAALFLALVRIKLPDESGRRRFIAPAVNLSGVLFLTSLAAMHGAWFGVPLDKNVCDIIIMILANIAIWGGLIWMFTKDSLKLRWLVIAFIASIKALDSYAPDTLSFVPSFSSISWFFNWEWLQYLLIALPGSIVGDMILQQSRSGEKMEISSKGIWAGALAMTAVILQLWGLFTRNVLADGIITAALCVAFAALTWKERNLCTRIGWLGFILLLTGIVFDPLDGGITKDYCNLSYVFTTGGMAALTTSFLLMLETRFAVRGVFLAGVGQNPMLAYTITTFLIRPLARLTGYYEAFLGLAVGSPFMGLVQGIIITGIMMVCTYAFTKARLFWRS